MTLSGTIKVWIWCVGFFCVTYYVYWVGGIDVVWYAAQFHVPTDKVHIAREPSDCDFWHAPVGLKGCHYERSVVALYADGREDYRYDLKTGELIDLRTNQPASGPAGPSKYDPKAKYDSVSISWIKTSD